jgi:hypothetical protein
VGRCTTILRPSAGRKWIVAVRPIEPWAELSSWRALAVHAMRSTRNRGLPLDLTLAVATVKREAGEAAGSVKAVTRTGEQPALHRGVEVARCSQRK